MKNLSLYLHIPFCVRKCDYCAFCSFAAADEKMIENYVNRLKQEIELRSKDYKSYLVDTIYIGGGTPNYLSGEKISVIVKSIYENFNIAENAEFSVELNAELVSENFIHTISNLGVNRVSLGVQSLNEKLLSSLNRFANFTDIEKSVNYLKKYNINNFSFDLMVGLPNQSIDDIDHSLQELEKLNPSHYSLYSLILEENTPLHLSVKNNITFLDEEKSEQQYFYAIEKLKSLGYHRYEVSAFSKDGKFSRHNYGYWRRKNYLGLGLSAHSMIENRRFKNTSIMKNYLENLDYEEDITLTKSEIIEEIIMLGLRTDRGVNMKKLKDDFDHILDKNIISELENLVYKKGDYLIATDSGLNLLNHIILKLTS